MSRGQDDVIDEAVVKIHPDLSTFQAELKTALAKQQKLKAQPTYKVKVVADGAGLKKSVADAVRAQMLLKNQPVYKVKVVADAKGLKKSIGDIGETTTKAAKKTENDLTKIHAKAARERRKADQEALNTSLAEGMAHTLKLQLKTIEKNLDRIRNANEKHQRAESAAREAEYKRENTRLRSLAEGREKSVADAIDAERKRHRSRTRNEAEQDEKTRADAEIADNKRTNARLRNELEKNEKDLADAQEADRKRTNSRLRNDDEKNQKERADAEVADLRRTNTRLRSEIEKNEKERSDALVEDRKRTNSRVRNEDEKAERQRGDAVVQDRARTNSRVRNADEAATRVVEQARQVENTRNLQRARNADEALTASHLRALDEMTRDEEKAAAERTKILKAEEKRRKESLAPFSKGQKLIDLGGEGLKPMSLLYGAVVAMTPALFAMGASAVQASTSIAALGAAGIGAALGIGAIAIAFKGIGDLLTLRKSVQNEATTKAANAAKVAVTSADELAQSKRNLADAQRDEMRANEQIHDARREAIRDLEDLRIAVRDLDNQYKSDRLTVAEKKRDALATERNFFATALDRARARQDVRDAETQLSDTTLQRKRKREDLQRSVSKGVEGSDKVRDAKERARDARDQTLNAQAAMRKSTTGLGGGLDKTSSAAAQLAQKLKELSPAAREMYYWFDKNEKVFKRLQRDISQKTLPGFNTFLKAITQKPKGGSSTLEIAARYAGELGAIIGEHVGEFGKFTQGPLFRGSMARIQKTNAAAFDKLGDALIKLADPITRILDKASPAFGVFADKVLELSTRFADFIEKADAKGDLADWFKKSRIEAKKWYDIAANIFTLLKNLFTAALPAGGSLVASFEEFTQSLADWSGSASGQKQLKDFFTKVENLPYAKILDFFKNAGIFFVGFRAFTLLKGINPIFALLGAIAAAHPKEFAEWFSKAADAIGKIIGYFAENPKATAGLLALIAVAKTGGALGFSLKLPAMDRLRTALTSKFKFLDKFLGGGATTGTMTVHAGVVNVYGAAGVPGGAPGKAGSGSRISGMGIGEISFWAIVYEELINSDAAKKARLRTEQAVVEILAGAARNLKPENLAKRLKDPIGSMMSDAVGLAAKLFGADRLPGAMGAEQAAMANLNKDIAGFKPTKANDPAVFRRGAVQTYIAKRTASVDELVAKTRARAGDIAARTTERFETEKSVKALTEKLKQYGIGEDKAKAYAKAVFGLNGLVYEETQRSLAAKDALTKTGGELDKTGKKARDAAADVGVLTDKLDEATGEKKFILTVEGEKKVFNTLENAAAYQQALRTGEVPTEAKLNQFKNQFAKQSGDPNLRKAAGGLIPGYSPNKRADNIPAMLTAKEYVQPVAAVEHYGTDFMEAIRTRQFPKFASGGPVSWPFKVQMPPETATAVTPPIADGGGGVATGSVKVAEIAELTARAMGASTKQLVALIEAGLVESGLRNINFGDRDSVGFLQQRPSQGWGTPTQLLNPAYATRKFMNAAKRMDTENITAGELAARIQRPAARYRGRYGERQADAIAVLNRNPPFVTSGGAGGNKAGLVAFGRWLQARGYDVSEHPAFGGVHGGHADNSQHYRGQAIDVNHGAGTSAREQAFLRKILPEAHRRGFRSIFMTAGHYNHAHFDLGRGHADGGLVARKYDSGGILPPGYSLAFNGTGQNETIRTDRQEQALGANRLDRRDLALLAQFMAGAVGNPVIAMDGRKVAETTNRYNYLPTGV